MLSNSGTGQYGQAYLFWRKSRWNCVEVQEPPFEIVLMLDQIFGSNFSCCLRSIPPFFSHQNLGTAAILTRDSWKIFFSHVALIKNASMPANLGFGRGCWSWLSSMFIGGSLSIVRNTASLYLVFLLYCIFIENENWPRRCLILVWKEFFFRACYCLFQLKRKKMLNVSLSCNEALLLPCIMNLLFELC